MIQVTMPPFRKVQSSIVDKSVLTFDVASCESLLLHTRDGDQYELFLFSADQTHRTAVDFEADFVQYVEETYVLVSENTQSQSEVLYLNLEGKVIHRFACGNNISDVKAVALDEIWIAYNDAGIHDGFPYGLYCYDRQGKVRFHYAAPQPLQGMVDGLDLNVQGKNILFSYFAVKDQPTYYLVSLALALGTVRVEQYWELNTFGESGFALSADQLLLMNKKPQLLRFAANAKTAGAYSLTFAYTNQSLKAPLIRTYAHWVYFFENGYFYRYGLCGKS